MSNYQLLQKGARSSDRTRQIMYKNALRAAWAEINVTNLDFNIRKIREKVGPNRKITGIIKADGYGHGSVKVADVLRANGVTSFGGATLSEAIRLRDAGFVSEEIIVIGLTPDPYVDTIVEYDRTCVTGSYTNAKALSDAAAKAGKVVNGYIVIDTGMGRIGYQPEDLKAVEEVIRINQLPNFHIQGVFSHFATADAADKTYSTMQESRFEGFCKKLIDAHIKIPYRTLANSAAIMEIPTAHFDQVRPGIILYGCYPSHEVDKEQLELKPAYVPGDVDSDGKVTSTDARLTLQLSVGKIRETDVENPAAADVDGQEGVTSTDARLILQKSVGKIDKFPVE